MLFGLWAMRMSNEHLTSNEWFTPWRAEGLAVYDARGELVAHTGITGNCSMQGAQLERMAQMIADAVNGAADEIERLQRERDEYRECAKSQADRAWQRLSDEPNALADLLEEAATVLDEPYHREKVAETMQRAAAALRADEPSEVRHGPCPCCGTEWTPNVAPIARVAIVDGEVSQTEIYAPGLPDGAHDLFPVPLERASQPPPAIPFPVRWAMNQLLQDLPKNRDWLNPDVEKIFREHEWKAETKTVVCERCRATKADDCYFAEDPPANCAHRPADETSESLPCVWRDGCRAPAACAAKGHCDGPFGKQVDAYVRERDSKCETSACRQCGPREMAEGKCDCIRPKYQR